MARPGRVSELWSQLRRQTVVTRKTDEELELYDGSARLTGTGERGRKDRIRQAGTRGHGGKAHEELCTKQTYGDKRDSKQAGEGGERRRTNEAETGEQAERGSSAHDHRLSRGCESCDWGKSRGVTELSAGSCERAQISRSHRRRPSQALAAWRKQSSSQAGSSTRRATRACLEAHAPRALALGPTRS